MSNIGEGRTLVGLGTDSKDNEAIYDNWSENYQADVKSWGYKLPEEAAALVFQHAPSDDGKDKLTILDAGAGDGLTGVALRRAGFANADITGSDISSKMLERAAERQCYNQTQNLDLNQPLNSIASNNFDIVQCIGTLTYVSPEAGTLAEFIRIAKSGGLVCYSNRTDKLNQWKEVETSLADQWKLIQKVGPIPYLPGNAEYGENVQVVIYLYEVL